MYRGMVVADAHCDTVLRLASGADLVAGDAECHIDVPKLARGGVDLQVFALWVNPSYMPQRATSRLFELLGLLLGAVSSASARLAVARSYGEFERNLAGGKTSVLLGIEGAHCLFADEASIDVCYELGIRLITLTWNNTNWLAAAEAQREVFGYGLTPSGRRAVERMSRLGVIVDVSHAATRTFWDVAELCGKPFIASHSCAKGVYQHSRNLDDEKIKAIAQAGGVVGVNFWSRALGPRRVGSIDDVIAHIEYILDLVGDEHVCFGSDFDGIPFPPEGLEDAGKFPDLIDRLLARGHSEETVGKIAGANLVRVFRDVCG